MGITIHFEGNLTSISSLPAVLEEARSFASGQGWPFVELPEEVRSLARVRDESDWDFVGSTSGIEIYPHDDAEFLRLEFDSDGYIQEFIKTQFAPIKVHIAVIDLLDKLKPYFASLDVVDESDYWENRDLISLKQSFDRFFEVVEDEKAKNPNLAGPFRMDDGRIVDLMD